ncbi:MAG: DNA-directed polymerase [Frankiales bacterium]|nr:DNA-directed polymerase [Frankiales bacterium]
MTPPLLPVSGHEDPALLRGTSSRLLWWRAAVAARPLVRAGVRPRACWDLAAVGRLLTGGDRDDPPAVWAAAHGRPLPSRRAPTAGTLLDVAPPDEPVVDGALVWDEDDGPLAPLASQVQQLQADALARLEDRRASPEGLPLPLLTAYAESSAALLAVELEVDGLPVDRTAAQAWVAASAGPRPVDAAHAQQVRAARDDVVKRAFGTDVDLRSNEAVLALLQSRGFDVADTRSWRLEPHRATSPAVAALLDWRKAERVATTYGYRWLDEHLADDGRLRGSWTAAEGAGRMTASAGLHSLPASFRSAVVAEPGHVLVRADLGQVEPRVLAVVSADPALAAAAREQDMYTPVAAALGVDRPTAKVAVLAAMYGQTSGTAGRALERMEAAYPRALAFLHDAETRGREGGELRTWGGRLLPLGTGGRGRFARNAVVQGAAAELFKVWAATVRGGGQRIVLCLHDELLLHVPQEQADDAVARVHAALDEAAGRWATGSGVRFVADVAVVRRWSEAKAG